MFEVILKLRFMESQKEIFDIDKIVQYLNRHKDKLPKIYNWKLNVEKLNSLEILEVNEYETLINATSDFERELKIKEIIYKKLHEFRSNELVFEKIYLWIVKDWGGISTGKNENIRLSINEFLGQTEKIGFERISSISKICSFMFPDKYVIYDSRVIYSINWILLLQNAGEKFFPIPEGRNSKMKAFDINTLIRIKNINNYRIFEKDLKDKNFISKADKSFFFPTKDAYKIFVDLIKEIHQKLWNNENLEKLYFTEMLLFSLADKEIYEEITNTISLKFST